MLPPPAVSTVYELTDAGRQLQPVLQALCNWGLRNLGPPVPGAELVPGWLGQALTYACRLRRPESPLTVHCGGETASIADGDARPGPVEHAQAVIDGDPAGFYHLLVDGDLSGVEVEGNASAVDQLTAAFAVPQRHVHPAAV